MWPDGVIPYEGEGRVFQVAPDTMLFMADYEGIMNVERAEGELDQAFVRCPAIQGEVYFAGPSALGLSRGRHMAHIDILFGIRDFYAFLCEALINIAV